ncbi:tight adherence protein F [Cricetibacter osteomyelitidis]|uniref:Tight adherence protein F n=1 Tax=Cricetibacter osteomyelitidis TaxID=1521931 RepID=A0A4R2TIN5_9PAST|nr:tight adherence pilus pseudopilin TadF [Cricetibacter osteomyelitidis]TCP94662.1 tight adherence protein F [Cricetibacter osteomyelitidis]
MEDRYLINRETGKSDCFEQIKKRCGLKGFLLNSKGSVTIEFIFMLILLVFVFAFLADLVILRSTMGRLDNASYSLVNILRERTQLYERSTTLTNDDLKNFQVLGTRLMHGKNSKENVSIVLEYWNADTGLQTLFAGDRGCTPYRRLNELSYLSPHSEINNERRIPLYQVTLCVRTHSFFKAILLDSGNVSDRLLRSSSMSVSR